MSPVDLGFSALAVVLVAGAIYGTLSIWVFRRFTDSAKLRTATNLVWAYLLELQLFAGEPSVILRAQRDLIVANARFFKLIGWPLLFLALLTSLIVAAGDAMFDYAPLPLGRAAVVTVQCAPTTNLEVLSGIHLVASRGLSIETPSVRMPSKRQICWRVRVSGSLPSYLEIASDQHVLTRSIASGPGAIHLPHFELPLRDPLIKSVGILYPDATVLSASWLLWFVLGSFAGAIFSAIRGPRVRLFRTNN